MRVDARPRFSSLNQGWRTPEPLYVALNQEFRFDFDPCAANDATIWDGKLVSWAGKRVFCNPPYDGIAGWIAKGREPIVAVYLLPARTGSGWFHDYALKADEIRFLRGRLRFHGAATNAPFDSCLVIFGA